MVGDQLAFHRTKPEALIRAYFEAGWYDDVSLADAMRASAAANASTRLIFHAATGSTRVVTLPQVFAAGERAARGLWARGLRTGDVLAVQSPNRVELAELYVAAFRLGLVLLPISPTCGAGETRYLLENSGARALAVSGADVRSPKDLLPLDRGAVRDIELVIAFNARELPAGATDWAEIGTNGPLPFGVPSNDNAAVLLYTSGTTSVPKGVVHTYHSIKAIAGFDPGHQPDRPEVVFQAFPAGHIAGILGVLRPFFSGFDSILTEHWTPDDAAALIEAHGATAMRATPFHFLTLVEAATRTGRSIRSLRALALGATSVPVEVMERAEQLGIAAYRSYGSSEHPALTTGTPNEPWELRALTDGRVQPGNEIKVVDEKGAPVAPGVEGEVCCRGTQQLAGYLDPRHAIGAFDSEGWFRTGDVGRIDPDRNLTIVGRKKEIIIRGGENISPLEVETVLLRHPAIADAAVVGMPHPAYGERIHAFVVMEDGHQRLDVTDLLVHFANEEVARRKTPEALSIVSELPRTANGKLQRRYLQASTVAAADGSEQD